MRRRKPKAASEESRDRRILATALVVAALFVIIGGIALGDGIIANLSVALAAAAAGVLLSFVMFLRSDDDMRQLKTLLLGALSGTALAKSEQITHSIAGWYAGLADQNPRRHLAHLFFFAISCGLAGVLGGYLALRLGLDEVFARKQAALKKLLGNVPSVPLGAASELDEFWPKLRGNLPDEKTVAELAKIEDWSEAPLDDVLRAAAIFIEKKRWSEALKALEPFVLSNEAPHPMAFDFYACALVGKYDWKRFDEETARAVDRLGSRMLTFWAESFLVNLDVGYLYLYVPKPELAEYYSRRAAQIRPESRAAMINLASALAQRHGASASEAVVSEIVGLLHRLYPGEAPDPKVFNQEGDFDALLKNASFLEALKSTPTSAA